MMNLSSVIPLWVLLSFLCVSASEVPDWSTSDLDTEEQQQDEIALLQPTAANANGFEYDGTIDNDVNKLLDSAKQVGKALMGMANLANQPKPQVNPESSKVTVTDQNQQQQQQQQTASIPSQVSGTTTPQQPQSENVEQKVRSNGDVPQQTETTPIAHTPSDVSQTNVLEPSSTTSKQQPNTQETSIVSSDTNDKPQTPVQPTQPQNNVPEAPEAAPGTENTPTSSTSVSEENTKSQQPTEAQPTAIAESSSVTSDQKQKVSADSAPSSESTTAEERTPPEESSVVVEKNENHRTEQSQQSSGDVTVQTPQSDTLQLPTQMVEKSQENVAASNVREAVPAPEQPQEQQQQSVEQPATESKPPQQVPAPSQTKSQTEDAKPQEIAQDEKSDKQQTDITVKSKSDETNVQKSVVDKAEPKSQPTEKSESSVADALKPQEKPNVIPLKSNPEAPKVATDQNIPKSVEPPNTQSNIPEASTAETTLKSAAIESVPLPTQRKPVRKQSKAEIPSILEPAAVMADAVINRSKESHRHHRQLEREMNARTKEGSKIAPTLEAKKMENKKVVPVVSKIEKVEEIPKIEKVSKVATAMNSNEQKIENADHPLPISNVEPSNADKPLSVVQNVPVENFEKSPQVVEVSNVESAPNAEQSMTVEKPQPTVEKSTEAIEKPSKDQNLAVLMVAVDASKNVQNVLPKGMSTKKSHESVKQSKQVKAHTKKGYHQHEIAVSSAKSTLDKYLHMTGSVKSNAVADAARVPSISLVQNIAQKKSPYSDLKDQLNEETKVVENEIEGIFRVK